MPVGRDDKIEIVALVVDTEKSFTFPNGVVYYELNARNNNEFRFAFEEGETADGGKFRTVPASLDWYFHPKAVLIDGRTIYLRCPSSNETIEILYLTK